MRKIPNPSDFKAAFCCLTYCNPKQIGGIFIAKLVVAEKPSVAMSYAKVLGATSRKDGYLEGNGYLVSWCIGHLVELAPPNVYDAKYVKWSIADLPILPQKWQYLVSASTKKQFGILQKLMHRPDVESIVNSCDSGREGELIFRLVYQQAGCKKPVSRLWLSSMEETAIREGFAHLKPSTEYDALYSASYSVDGLRWAKPSQMADSSMLDSHRREKGFLHPACWYTKRKISSPSRPASVAQITLSTSGRCISFCRMPNCFLVLADTRYCHFCGRMGKSAMLHLTYLAS